MSHETQSGYRARRSGPARFLSAYGQEIVIAGAINDLVSEQRHFCWITTVVVVGDIGKL